MIKKSLVAFAFAALLACGSAHAGYAQLAAPAGFGGSPGAFTYAANAANDKIFGRVIHSAGALTANVGGQAVKMPAAYRLAANAPRIAAQAIFLHPGIRTAAGIALWLGAGKLVWDEATRTWRQEDDRPAENVVEWRYRPEHSWTTMQGACGQVVAYINAADAGSGFSSSLKSCTNGQAVLTRTNGQWSQDHFYPIESRSRTGDGNCPAGWTPTPAGCLSPALTQPEMVELLNPANQPGWPMPDSVPLELPSGTPLPIEQPSPWINPTPGENPQSQPLRIPSGQPTPVPNTDPQQYRQPYVDIVPSPTPDNPWRVDVKPGETVSTDPNPVENPKPDGQDKPTEEQDKSLCEKHPEIAACEKVEVTDKPLPDQPKLYEPKYPDGITGLWNSKLQEIKATPLFNLAPALLPNVSTGSCPSWKIDLSIDGWTNAGLQDVSPPCWVWDVAKLVIIASALLLARRLIFGG